AADCVDHAGALLEVVFNAPETSACEVGGFGLYGLTFSGHFLTFLVELQRCGIQTVSLACRRRTIGKHMPQMRAASRAVDFRAHHAVTAIYLPADMLGIKVTIKTRPAGAGVKLMLACK